MHGLGNDFVVIDAINQAVVLTAQSIKELADRHYGVGFDQLLVVKQTTGDADFRYVIYNADGSEVSQCGNGARCFALFVRQKGLTDKRTITVETGAGELVLNINEQNDVTVDMGEPQFLPEKIPLLAEREQPTYSVDIANNAIEFSALSMGNPHAVIQVDSLDSAPVGAVGAAMESHDIFPQRANIGFSQTINPSNIALRVYERGAGETLACGSGACAAVVAGIERGELHSPVTVQLTGEKLSIAWQGRGHPVIMAGAATFVFDGMIEL
ncbi:MAG: diaminopimelate epimerase [Cycloclasticus sp. symbiont of Poecilosclerida sp. N]|nr:MAG: diaminopimelate epimerase [Cycloclasticus sp. symbiont of Poecilosclerida sp. N]